MSDLEIKKMEAVNPIAPSTMMDNAFFFMQGIALG
jgi:hypothetical protein